MALATVIEHPDPSVARAAGSWSALTRTRTTVATARSARPRADAAVRDDALGLLAAGSNATLTYGPDGERRGEGMRVFVWGFAPKPRMLVFGAIDFAAAVARVGSFLGYHVTVCDARPVFATTSRFPDADEVVVDWPHRYLAAEQEAGRVDQRTVVTVLTHDPKFDVPLLEVALRLPAVAYVGAMGSRRTHDDRLERLLEAGLTDEELARLSSPIGLDLGARTPRRPRSASRRRSSPRTGAAPATGWPSARDASTTPDTPSGPPPVPRRSRRAGSPPACGRLRARRRGAGRRRRPGALPASAGRGVRGHPARRASSTRPSAAWRAP